MSRAKVHGRQTHGFRVPKHGLTAPKHGWRIGASALWRAPRGANDNFLVPFPTDGKKLKNYINKILTSREKEIIELRYGLNDGKEVTQREIAQRLNISRSYVSRIEKKALKKLKAAYH